MKSPVLLSDAQKAEMVEMYKNGSSIRTCARQFQVDTSTAHKWLRVAGIQLRDSQRARRIYTCDEYTFDKQFDAEHTYWFGFLLADGCIFQRAYGSALLSIALAEKDVDHLEKFRQFLKAEHPIRREPKTGSVRLSILSDPLCESLLKRGCTPRKSLELEYPAYGYLYCRHFVRGYFDGDGSIYVSEHKYCSPTVSFVGTQAFQKVFKKSLCSKLESDLSLLRAIHILQLNFFLMAEEGMLRKSMTICMLMEELV